MALKASCTTLATLVLVTVVALSIDDDSPVTRIPEDYEAASTDFIQDKVCIYAVFARLQSATCASSLVADAHRSRS